MIILAIILTSIVTTLGCLFLFAGKLAIEKMVAYDRGWNDGYKAGMDSMLEKDDPHGEYVSEETNILRFK
ncbi:hypothetical protein KAR91_31780 [Candidatus Pacearchaeota archaeon]|nr:hypothetical protein [Candidatus Pacearchaeota archaeon]